MKHETIVGIRLPADLVRDLERIERIEHSDRSTTVRSDEIRAGQTEHGASRTRSKGKPLGNAILRARTRDPCTIRPQRFRA
jgi:hypothetical protein